MGINHLWDFCLHGCFAAHRSLCVHINFVSYDIISVQQRVLILEWGILLVYSFPLIELNRHKQMQFVLNSWVFS
jgi:hypothetical protein